MKLRQAKTKDVKEMQSLINYYADKEEMLPRSLNDIYENIQEYSVIEDKKKIIGCAALHVSWDNLAEVKSLAVHEKYQHKGLGARLVKVCEKKAKELGITSVFALTYKPGFFITQGYKKISREKLPHKVWGECVKCPKFPDCGEVPLIKELK
ncbi:MAG: N-acetyltransferase [Elusimicrobiota bacterium]